MRGRVAAIALAAVAGASCLARREPVELRLSLEEGRAIVMTVRVEQTVTEAAEGREVRVRQQSTTVYRLESRGRLPDGSTALAARWDDLAIRMDVAGAEILFDSRAPAEATPGLEPLARLCGRSLSFVADPRGRVREVRGLAALALELAPDNPRARAVLDQLLDERMVRTSLEGFLGLLPPTPVRAGESWDVESTLPFAGGLRARTRLTLRDVTGATCTLSLVSAVGAAAGSAGRGGGGVTGSQEGKVTVDRKTGTVVAGEIRQRLTGAFTGPGGTVPLLMEGLVRLTGETAP
jgi:hypothetical protein